MEEEEKEELKLKIIRKINGYEYGNKEYFLKKGEFSHITEAIDKNGDVTELNQILHFLDEIESEGKMDKILLFVNELIYNKGVTTGLGELLQDAYKIEEEGIWQQKKDNESNIDFLRKQIIRKLLGKDISIFNLATLNGRSEIIRKNSRLNELINIINTIYEKDSEIELYHILAKLTDLEKEGKLDEIRQIDLIKEVKQEYVDEYNDAATRYDKLSDEELDNIDGLEYFYHNGQRIIVLNGAPFRFLGRTIAGNSDDKNLTDSSEVGYTTASLISNLRPNRWRSTCEFDVFDDIADAEKFGEGFFGAADAAIEKDRIISPEILQRIVSSEGTPGSYHTHLMFEGEKKPIATFLELDSELDLDENQKYRPYSTIYIYNPKPYSEQIKQMKIKFHQLSPDEIIKQFEKTADSELFLFITTASTKYNEDKIDNKTEESTELTRQLIEKVDFSSCDNTENLRYISAFIEIADSFGANHMLDDNLKLLKKKCDIRLKEIAKTKPFSIRDEVESCIEEIHTKKKSDPRKTMTDFIQSEIKKAQDGGWFVEGDSVEEELEDKEKMKEQEQANNGAKVQDISGKIINRQVRLDKIYEILEISKPQNNLYELASIIEKIGQNIGDSHKISYKESSEIAKQIVDEIAGDFDQIYDEQKDELKRNTSIKIHSLIKLAQISEIDKKIEKIDSRKKGLFDRLTGKKKYVEAVRESLNTDKRLINLEEKKEDLGIDDLLDYISKNGMTSEIMDFLIKYRGISDSAKEKIIRVLEDDGKGHQEPSLDIIPKLRRKEYIDKSNKIEKETEGRKKIIREKEKIKHHDDFRIRPDEKLKTISEKVSSISRRLSEKMLEKSNDEQERYN